MDIKIRTRAVDGGGESRTFKTLEGARKYASKVLGPNFDVGMGYAVSGSGTLTLRVAGANLSDLFPQTRDPFPQD